MQVIGRVALAGSDDLYIHVGNYYEELRSELGTGRQSMCMTILSKLVQLAPRPVVGLYIYLPGSYIHQAVSLSRNEAATCGRVDGKEAYGARMAGYAQMVVC